MKNFSSKYLNLNALKTSVMDCVPSSDAVILLTNFGYIIGELHFDSTDDNLNIANFIGKLKSKTIEAEDLDVFGDGSMICVKNAIVKYSNNMTINFNDLTVHCDDVVGFSPINKSDFLSQLPQDSY